MNIQETMGNHSIVKRFLKDYKLPIQVFQDPYLEYFLELYDDFHQSKSKFKRLTNMTSHLEHGEQFFEINRDVFNLFKEKFTQFDAYQKFQAIDLRNDFKIQKKIESKDFYQEENLNKKFISIDLKKANFNIFKFLDDKQEIPEYSTFLTTVIHELHHSSDMKKDIDAYFQESKMIRQVIFGELNPSKQQAIQRFVISQICQEIEKHGLQVNSASSDEIIVKNCDDISQMKSILSQLPQEYQFFRVEKFKLEKIHPEKNFFLKISTANPDIPIYENNFIDSFKENQFCYDIKMEIKNHSQFLYPQIYKQLIKEPVNDLDKTFYYEGFLSLLKDDLFNEKIMIKKLKI